MAESCTTKSATPTWVTVGFMTCYFIMLLVTSFYSIKSLKQKHTTTTIKISSEKKYSSYETCTTNPDRSVRENEALSQKNGSNDISITVSENTGNKSNEEEESKEKEILKQQNKENDRTSTAIPQDKSEWDKVNTFGKLKMWAKDVYKRKNVYLPLVAHLSDTATDFAAIAEFGEIASMYSASECGINVWYLFTLSILAMLVYRIVSSFTVYRITKSVKRTILQFIDIELFQILWLSHRLGLKNKSSPQRLISVLEAVFEAAPQTMVQLVYLISTRNLSGVIVFSTILSILNLTMTVIGDDKNFATNAISNDSQKHDRDAFFLHKEATYEQGKMHCTSRGNWITLHLFRFFDIPSQILMYVFIWYVINGYILIVVFVADVAVALYLYKKTNDVDALTTILAIPFDLQSDIPREEIKGMEPLGVKLLRWFVVYSVVRSVIIVVVIWIMIVVNGWISSGGFLWVFCSIAAITKYCLRSSLEFGSVKAKERVNPEYMLRNKLYDDAISLIFYLNMDFDANVKKLYSTMLDKDQIQSNNDGITPSCEKYSLLAIAAGCRLNTELFEYILNKYGLDIGLNDDNEQYKTALIVATEKGVRNAKCIKSIMNITDWDYIQKKDSNGTALWRAIVDTEYYGESKPTDTLVEYYLGCIDEKIQNDKDYNDKKIDLLNECAADGGTALHLVAQKARYKVFKSVYDFYPAYYKVDIMLKKNEEGKTPLDYNFKILDNKWVWNPVKH